VIVNWVIPFVILLPQWTKRNRAIVKSVALLVLLGHWLDLYLSIAPPFGGGVGMFLWAAVAAAVGLAVAWSRVSSLIRRAGRV
jgi:hypothetical protein